MASCKDCVHVGVCRFKDLPAPLSDSYIRESECIEKRCGDFKDRSRFVELPCKVGERLFVPIPKSKYIAEYAVIAFWVEESGTIIRIVDTRFFTVSVLFCSRYRHKSIFNQRASRTGVEGA